MVELVLLGEVGPLELHYRLPGLSSNYTDAEHAQEAQVIATVFNVTNSSVTLSFTDVPPDSTMLTVQVDLATSVVDSTFVTSVAAATTEYLAMHGLDEEIEAKVLEAVAERIRSTQESVAAAEANRAAKDRAGAPTPPTSEPKAPLYEISFKNAEGNVYPLRLYEGDVLEKAVPDLVAQAEKGIKFAAEA